MLQEACPDHQTAELPTTEAAKEAVKLDEEIEGGIHSSCDEWPLSCWSYLVVASFFLLREIEASLLLAINVVFNR